MAQQELTRFCVRCEGTGRSPVSKREAEIFRAYEAERSLAEVGRKFGVSRQYVHQVVTSIDPAMIKGGPPLQRGTGQVARTPCTCGHELQDHGIQEDDGSIPCTECDCQMLQIQKQEASA